MYTSSIMQQCHYKLQDAQHIMLHWWILKGTALVIFSVCPIIYVLEAPGAKERKLAGWGLRRGKAWKGSLNVAGEKKKKNAPQMEANTAITEDAPTVIFFLHAVSEGDPGNPNGMIAGKPQNCACTWVSQPCNAKNTVNTPVFDSMDGGGGWTHDLRVTSRQGGRGGRGGGGGRLSLIVSRNWRIQPLAYSLLKQEELQLA